MNKHLQIFLFLLINLSFLKLLGQTTHQPIYYVHDIYSPNEKYYLKTIPFDNIEQTQIGKTIVFNSNGDFIYEIQRHFEKSENQKEILLSNDGRTVIYIIDREFTHKEIESKSIEIYKNGKLVNSYSLSELINCNSDNEDCYLTYKEAIENIKWEKGKKNIIFKSDATEFEKQITEKSIYIENDTIYIFTKDKQIILLDLETLKLEKLPLKEMELDSFKPIKVVSQSEKLKLASMYDLPNISNGISLEKAIANHLNMAVFPDDENNSDKYKSYSVKLEIIIDTLGNAFVEGIENYKKLPEDKIVEFVQSSKFETNSIPNLTEKWRFEGWITLMNKSKRKAKKERKQELLDEQEAYKNRIIADTINGLYIPKNLEECFLELNKLLKPKDIETIKSLKDRNETIQYHLNFGMWLRNNWGLWGGSRLQQYFIRKGIHHPDEMSSTILQYYYDWLNEQHTAWKEFEIKSE